ncbi:MAG: UbiD family decarboxylase [Desulfobacterales bacterium]|nr:UbiD family decarboxylase [Desulfobacterales bacterium]
MNREILVSMRNTIEFLKGQGEVSVVTGQVDPIYEIAGIQKALEDGPAFLFENIKGYPGVRDVGNLFARMDRIAKMFGEKDPKKMKFRCLEAIKNPIPSVTVGTAPCQEVVITEGIDVMNTLPILKHTENDAGRILGGGNIFVGPKYFRGGTHLSFNRTHFRGADWASIMGGPPTHLGVIAYMDHRDERIPMTINIGTPPAVNLIAGGGNVHAIIPVGTDKVAIAGGLQGFPVETVDAKTVEAQAIAQSEWVIEGYLETESVWESDAAEASQKAGVTPFFPEWPGYLGKSYRFRKFKATAITHRKDRPIFFSPLAFSFEGTYLITVLREAMLYEIAERTIPGLVVDVNTLHGVTIQGGIIYQVKKRRPWDEGYQKNILTAALGSTAGIRMVVVVDEDIDIYNADDVLWAITTRVDPQTDILSGSRGGRGTLMQPLERMGGLGGGFDGGLGIDATVPFNAREEFQRARYPVDKVDLNRWFSDETIQKIKTSQSEYARVLARVSGQPGLK